MIFSCGLTWEEEKRRRGEWRDFFALLPRTVRVENGRKYCAWLQTIQRRSKRWDCRGYGGWIHEYRLKQNGTDGDSRP